MHDLRIHDRVHVKDKPYKCDFRLWSFTIHSYFLDHEHSHIGEKTYTSDICVKLLSS